MAKILHAYADHGVESEALSVYGDVIRISINAKENNYSSAITADATNPPFDDSTEFDIGLFHPPCTKWSDMPSANKDDDAKNLIADARRVAKEYCDEYIIENKPRAPLKNPTVLNGKMFSLPIKYERAFETSFDVGETPDEQNIDTEVSPYFYSDRSRKWWASVKGYADDYGKQHMAKNCVPAPYIHHLMRSYLRSTNERDKDLARSSHSDPTPRRLQ
jgi:hypothetical protein